MIGDGVEMIGVEAAGKGLKTGMHSATLKCRKKRCITWYDDLSITGQ